MLYPSLNFSHHPDKKRRRAFLAASGNVLKLPQPPCSRLGKSSKSKIKCVRSCQESFLFLASTLLCTPRNHTDHDAMSASCTSCSFDSFESTWFSAVSAWNEKLVCDMFDWHTGMPMSSWQVATTNAKWSRWMTLRWQMAGKIEAHTCTIGACVTKTTFPGCSLKPLDPARASACGGHGIHAPLAQSL